MDLLRNRTPRPIERLQLLGWGFVIGMCVLAVPHRIAEIAGAAL